MLRKAMYSSNAPGPALAGPDNIFWHCRRELGLKTLQFLLCCFQLCQYLCIGVWCGRCGGGWPAHPLVLLHSGLLPLLPPALPVFLVRALRLVLLLLTVRAPLRVRVAHRRVLAMPIKQTHPDLAVLVLLLLLVSYTANLRLKLFRCNCVFRRCINRNKRYPWFRQNIGLASAFTFERDLPDIQPPTFVSALLLPSCLCLLFQSSALVYELLFGLYLAISPWAWSAVSAALIV